MPCRSDYLEPSDREKELKRAAGLLVYVCQKTGVKPPLWAVKEAANVYASDERSVTVLCAKLTAMSPKKRDAIVYNPRDKNARDLASWWEEHQAADAKRLKEEAAERTRKRLARSGRKKLTAGERRALGVK